MTSIKTNNFEIFIEGVNEEYHVSLSKVEIEGAEDNVEYIKLLISSYRSFIPSKIKLCWMYPINDIQAQWNPLAGFKRGFVADWGAGSKSKITSGAPIHCLYNNKAQNRLTFALSDALNAIKIKCGVNEETANFKCILELFIEPMPSITNYEALLRIDTRNKPYYEVIDDVSKWWSSFKGFKPAIVPDIARLPMYSTWYSFHQKVNVEEITRQCRIAKTLGCEAVIVDDGWQTEDNGRGYAFCGDWEPAVSKISDMKNFVKEIHKLGMKFLLWYSVPFIGKYSKAWNKFSDKVLDPEKEDWCVLDPRFPEVREYLIHIYEKAVREWNLDGLKLDFVDQFNLTESSKNAFGNGRDYDSVPEAVDRLLKDVLEKLRTIKPDFMIEFRQSYIGPLMRTYGNMFRANDCPNDSLTNRIEILDVRLLSGGTAVHSDMVMWNYGEPVESAALQLINVLFSVPQISVHLDKIPEKHFKMVKYWLKFWRENRDVLLDGKLMPQNPEALYTKVYAEGYEKFIAVVYCNGIIKLPKMKHKKYIFVNGSFETHVIIDTDKNINNAELEVMDCTGDIITSETICLNCGINVIEVPRSGIVNLACSS